MFSDLSARTSLCSPCSSASVADTNCVGINQPAPQYELDVGGTVYADRYANVAYADLVGRPTRLSSFSNDLASFPRALAVGYCNLQLAGWRAPHGAQRLLK